MTMTDHTFLKLAGIGTRPHAYEHFKLDECTVIHAETETAKALAVTTALAVIRGQQPPYKGIYDIFIRSTFRNHGGGPIRHQFRWSNLPDPAISLEVVEFPNTRTMPAYRQDAQLRSNHSILAQPAEQHPLPLPADNLRRLASRIMTVESHDHLDEALQAVQGPVKQRPKLVITEGFLPEPDEIHRLTRHTQVVALIAPYPNRLTA